MLGVCFTRTPHFILLELMSGGDLKSHLKVAHVMLAP